MRLSLAVVIIHFSFKTPSRMACIVTEDSSPLLDTLLHGIKGIVRNQVKLSVTSVTKLAYLRTVKCKAVRLGCMLHAVKKYDLNSIGI